MEPLRKPTLDDRWRLTECFVSVRDSRFYLPPELRQMLQNFMDWRPSAGDCRNGRLDGLVRCPLQRFGMMASYEVRQELADVLDAIDAAIRGRALAGRKSVHYTGCSDYRHLLAIRLHYLHRGFDVRECKKKDIAIAWDFHPI